MFKRFKRSSSLDKNLTGVQNLITVPGSIFNEVNKGALADQPGTGRTIRSNAVCNALFDYQNKFNVASCKGRDVLIVSHNKRLQQLIGEMFPEFLANKGGTCPYGIANCAVLEITKNNYEDNKPNFSDPIINVVTKENMNKFRKQLETQNSGKFLSNPTYQLRVLFDGFPDKTICQATIVPNRSYDEKDGEKHWIQTRYERKGLRGGGGDQYAYLTSDKYEFEVDVADVEGGTFSDIFNSGANKILLVRHGNGPHNKPCANKLFKNPPLTALGVYQAYIAGTEMAKKNILNVNNMDSFKIFTSQLKRAQQTTLQFLAALLTNADLKKACEDCLRRFNADTKQIDKSGFSSKISMKSCSFQKLYNDPKFFESEFMRTHASDYNKSDFVAFVIKYDLTNPIRVNSLRKNDFANSNSNSMRSGESGYASLGDVGLGEVGLGEVGNDSGNNRKNHLIRPVSGKGMAPYQMTSRNVNNTVKGITGVGNGVGNGAGNNYYGDVGGKKTRRRRPTKEKRTTKKTVGKKTVGKKTVGKKTMGKKTVGKKTVGKKTVGKKRMTKKRIA